MISSLVDILNDMSEISRSLAVVSDFYNLYGRKPHIDLSESKKKFQISNLQGNIKFKNVSFYYPSDESKNWF